MRTMPIHKDALPAVLGMLFPLLVLLPILLLTGCMTTPINPNCPPPTPRLNWSPAEDGGVCVSAESTAMLLDYLDGLERCVVQ